MGGLSEEDKQKHVVLLRHRHSHTLDPCAVNRQKGPVMVVSFHSRPDDLLGICRQSCGASQRSSITVLFVYLPYISVPSTYSSMVLTQSHPPLSLSFHKLTRLSPVLTASTLPLRLQLTRHAAASTLRTVDFHSPRSCQYNTGYIVATIHTQIRGCPDAHGLVLRGRSNVRFGEYCG